MKDNGHSIKSFREVYGMHVGVMYPRKGASVPHMPSPAIVKRLLDITGLPLDVLFPVI